MNKLPQKRVRKNKQRSLTLTPELREAIRAQAKQQRVSEGEVIRRVLRQSLQIEAFDIQQGFRTLEAELQGINAKLAAITALVEHPHSSPAQTSMPKVPIFPGNDPEKPEVEWDIFGELPSASGMDFFAALADIEIKED